MPSSSEKAKRRGTKGAGASVTTIPTALARAKWESSGLTAEHATALRFRALSAEETEALGTNFLPAQSLLLPYFDLKGRPTDFFRVRYLEKLPGWAGVVERPQRYAQPKGSLNEVYLPPLLPRPWDEIARDTSVPVYICEGELKAACAAAHGLACIGLGGVDVWRSAKRGIELLPALAEIDWKGREVVIVFDSDAATNPGVMRAQLRLAQELLGRSARPSIASIPPKADGSKQGLDDLVVAEGPEALTSILEKAPAFKEAEALHQMNAEVAFIERPGVILVQEDGHLMRGEAFVKLDYADRHYMAAEMSKDGAPILKKKRLAPRWIEWEGRFKLNRIVYAPACERIVVQDGKRSWNCWAKWGCEPKKGEVSPWVRLLDHLFRGAQPEDRIFFERWCAYPLQHPGSKLYTAAVLWGRNTGTGKSFVGELLRKIYGVNSVLVNKDNLTGAFNGLFDNRQFVQGDEITGDDSPRKVADKLKATITQEEMWINRKFIPEYLVPTCINYLFTSNHADAFFLTDEDRRYFVHEVTAAGAGQPGGLPTKFYDDLREWKNGVGPSHLFHHLLNLDLGAFNPRAHAPMTDAKRDMIEIGKSPLQRWAEVLREAPETALAPLPELLAKREILTGKQLCLAYDPENRYPGGHEALAGKLGAALKDAGIPRQRTRTGMVYAIRAREKWRVAHLERWIETLREYGDSPGPSRTSKVA